MSSTYRYGHRKVRRRHIIFVTLLVCLLCVGAGGYLIFRDLRISSQQSTVEGAERVVGQVVGETSSKITIEQPFFSFQLPADWKEFSRVNSPHEQSITWRATLKNQDARQVTIYVDRIPPDIAVNRLLPVVVQESSMQTGDVSDNCATFTGGGTLDVQKAQKLANAKAKWSGVDFICNMSNIVDNQVGVGAPGAINQITLTGPQSGAHKYFFVYIDRSIQPNYSILTSMLESFRAK